MYFLIALRPDSMYPGTGLPAAERGGGAGVRGPEHWQNYNEGKSWLEVARWTWAQPGLADI